MDKTSQKVTKDKDPKRVDVGRKGRGSFIKNLKENILNDAKKGGGNTTNSSNETTSATNNASNETTSVTNIATTRSNDTYFYGVGIIAVFANGVCVFLHITLFNLKIKNSSMKKRINHQNEIICLKKICNK